MDDEIIALFYYDDDNCFVDENGCIVYNLFDYVTPNELLIFKQEREDLFITKPDGKYIEIIYPEYLPF